MELSPTAHVILGMLGWRPMSGYEMKSIVDKSTRFFWAASYGQIYPELRRLAKAGLVEGEADPQGARKRNVYRLTEAGRAALRGWLARDPEVFELRDEGLLKLFFASATDGDSAASTLAAMGREHRAIVEELEATEAAGPPGGFAYIVLRYGIEFHEWIADWAENARRALEDAPASDEKVA